MDLHPIKSSHPLEPNETSTRPAAGLDTSKSALPSAFQAIEDIGKEIEASQMGVGPEKTYTAALLLQTCTELRHIATEIFPKADTDTRSPAERLRQQDVLHHLAKGVANLRKASQYVESDARAKDLRALSGQISELSQLVNNGLERLNPLEATLQSQAHNIEQGKLDYSSKWLLRMAIAGGVKTPVITHFCEQFHAGMRADVKEARAQLALAHKLMHKSHDVEAWKRAELGKLHWIGLYDEYRQYLEVLREADANDPEIAKQLSIAEATWNDCFHGEFDKVLTRHNAACSALFNDAGARASVVKALEDPGRSWRNAYGEMPMMIPLLIFSELCYTSMQLKLADG